MSRPFARLTGRHYRLLLQLYNNPSHIIQWDRLDLYLCLESGLVNPQGTALTHAGNLLCERFTRTTEILRLGVPIEARLNPNGSLEQRCTAFPWKKLSPPTVTPGERPEKWILFTDHVALGVGRYPKPWAKRADPITGIAAVQMFDSMMAFSSPSESIVVEPYAFQRTALDAPGLIVFRSVMDPRPIRIVDDIFDLITQQFNGISYEWITYPSIADWPLSIRVTAGRPNESVTAIAWPYQVDVPTPDPERIWRLRDDYVSE